MGFRRFATRKLKDIDDRSGAYTGQHGPGGATWTIHKNLDNRNDASGLPTGSGGDERTGTTADAASSPSPMSGGDGGSPSLKAVPATWWSWIHRTFTRAIPGNSASSAPYYCPTCKAPLRYFIFGSFRTVRSCWLHPDGTVRDDQHRRVSMALIFGGDGGL